MHGPLRDVVVCHCTECRRWSGHVWAATAAQREHLVVAPTDALRWIDSPHSVTHARRAFCSECGSSLFWEAPGRETISIAAGSLDAPTGLTVLREIYLDFAGDYYDVPAQAGDDGVSASTA
ncbi:MAG TPA: GFA family protein [Gaiellaceae bacterium]|nr:GFA family protein [Gaiellaceae bacterium]